MSHRHSRPHLTHVSDLAAGLHLCSWCPWLGLPWFRYLTHVDLGGKDLQQALSTEV